MRTRVVAAVAILMLLVPAACSSDDETGTDDTAAGGTASMDSEPSQVDSLTADEICERLSIASVGADTGLDVVRAVPDDAATPQCAYEYTTESSGVSNLTVASMRPEDVGGLTGTDAFDLVVQINESVAGEGAETQEVSAGDAAIRISGPSVQLGVVQVGDRVLTLVIPADIEDDAVDRLIATMATTLR